MKSRLEVRAGVRLVERLLLLARERVREMGAVLGDLVLAAGEPREFLAENRIRLHDSRDVRGRPLVGELALKRADVVRSHRGGLRELRGTVAGPHLLGGGLSLVAVVLDTGLAVLGLLALALVGLGGIGGGNADGAGGLFGRDKRHFFWDLLDRSLCVKNRSLTLPTALQGACDVVAKLSKGTGCEPFYGFEK